MFLYFLMLSCFIYNDKLNVHMDNRFELMSCLYLEKLKVLATCRPYVPLFYTTLDLLKSVCILSLTRICACVRACVRACVHVCLRVNACFEYVHVYVVLWS